MNQFTITLALGTIFMVVLLCPLFIKEVENNLEAFLFVMGLIAATVSQVWTLDLVEEALSAPIKITSAVLGAGLLFYFFRDRVDSGVNQLLKMLPLKIFIGITVTLLGLLSSVISVIIAALILVEIVSILQLNRKTESNITIVGCLAIGMGAVLTPLGEPLTTIAISKLGGDPYHAGFFFLAGLLGALIVPGVIASGIIASLLMPQASQGEGLTDLIVQEKIKDPLLRSAKVYLFVMALILLGSGFKPIINWYFVNIPAPALFWVNTVSAILDNATLTAAEIGPSLSLGQIEYALMGLIISGIMLIPGNIPNIICASRLGITSREWARLGAPLGLGVMMVYFLILFLVY